MTLKFESTDNLSGRDVDTGDFQQIMQILNLLLKKQIKSVGEILTLEMFTSNANFESFVKEHQNQ